MYKNYTYSKYPHPLKYGWRWYCSKVKNCKAYLITSHDNKILAVTGYHVHAPKSDFNYPINYAKSYVANMSTNNYHM